MQLTDLVDREEIRRTLSAYTIAGDRFRLVELAEAFTEDGVLETERFTCRGREEIVRTLSGSLDTSASGLKPTFVRHHLTTSAIETLEGDHATARSYFFVLSDRGPDHAGVYLDTLRRSGASWLLTHRKVRIDWRIEGSMLGGDAKPRPIPAEAQV